jgi:putative membrane protein insertion efficiency factor
MKWLFIQFVLLYRVALRPIMGGHCRYEPSCSQYAIDAINKYGAFRGAWRALKRNIRFHTIGGQGYDTPRLLKTHIKRQTSNLAKRMISG